MRNYGCRSDEVGLGNGCAHASTGIEIANWCSDSGQDSPFAGLLGLGGGAADVGDVGSRDWLLVRDNGEDLQRWLRQRFGRLDMQKRLDEFANVRPVTNRS